MSRHDNVRLEIRYMASKEDKFHAQKNMFSSP